jgi:hypothetical protein
MDGTTEGTARVRGRFDAARCAVLASWLLEVGIGGPSWIVGYGHRHHDKRFPPLIVVG